MLDEWLSNGVIAVGVGLVTLYVTGIATRKRTELGYTSRKLLFGSIAGWLAWSFAPGTRDERIAFSVITATVTMLLVRRPFRSRHIPAHIRRAVIARDLKGQKFDGRIHHIDHIVPYSRGGDNSMENLRVVKKEVNQKRGNRMPRLRDLF